MNALDDFWYEVWDADKGKMIDQLNTAQAAINFSERYVKIYPQSQVQVIFCRDSQAVIVTEFTGDKHADMRDKKIHKKKYGMQVSNRSIKSVILPLLGRKPKKNG